MSEKARKRKNQQLKLRKSIEKQKKRKNQDHEEIKKYLIKIFKERTPGIWETLKKSEPAWFAQFTKAFNNSSEMISRKLKLKGLAWSGLTDAKKRDIVKPVLEGCVDSLIQMNEYLGKLKIEEKNN
jgi:hypothetical protein